MSEHMYDRCSILQRLCRRGLRPSCRLGAGAMAIVMPQLVALLALGSESVAAQPEAKPPCTWPQAYSVARDEASGILALSTVIFTFVITRIRPDTIHPTVFGPSAENAKGGFDVGEGMGPAIGVNMMVFTMLLAPTLIWFRVRLENLKEDIYRIKIELMNQ